MYASAELALILGVAFANAQFTNPSRGDVLGIDEPIQVQWNTDGLTAPLNIDLVPSGPGDDAVAQQVGVNIQNTGTLEFTPGADATGADAFQLRMTDAAGTVVDSDPFSINDLTQGGRSRQNGNSAQQIASVLANSAQGVASGNGAVNTATSNTVGAAVIDDISGGTGGLNGAGSQRNGNVVGSAVGSSVGGAAANGASSGAFALTLGQGNGQPPSFTGFTLTLSPDGVAPGNAAAPVQTAVNGNQGINLGGALSTGVLNTGGIGLGVGAGASLAASTGVLASIAPIATGINLAAPSVAGGAGGLQLVGGNTAPIVFSPTTSAAVLGGTAAASVATGVLSTSAALASGVLASAPAVQSNLVGAVSTGVVAQTVPPVGAPGSIVNGAPGGITLNPGGAAPTAGVTLNPGNGAVAPTPIVGGGTALPNQPIGGAQPVGGAQPSQVLTAPIGGLQPSQVLSGPIGGGSSLTLGTNPVLGANPLPTPLASTGLLGVPTTLGTAVVPGVAGAITSGATQQTQAVGASSAMGMSAQPILLTAVFAMVGAMLLL